MKYLIGIIGLIVFLGLAWIASSGKKELRSAQLLLCSFCNLFLATFSSIPE